MSPTKFKFVILVVLVILALGFGGLVNATEQPLDWFAHGFATSHVVAQLMTDGETRLLMDGALKFSPPEGFQIQYYTSESPVTITSHAGFVEVRTESDVQYGHDRYWLFDDLQRFVFALAEFSRLQLDFRGTDEIAGYTARRYTTVNDPELVLWFNEHTGLPFLIRRGDETLVVVSSYIVDPPGSEQIASVELKLLYADDPAIVTLEQSVQGWSLSSLEVQEKLGLVLVEFSDWSFAQEWIDSPLPRLQKLSELNEQFLDQFYADDFENSLKTSQEILTLAPQFWQVYLYQAFAYEALGNYLGVVENYQQVLMRQPNNHLALNNLAYHYLLREVQISQALEMAERAVELERKDIYLDTLGYGYYLVERYEEAKELLSEALETAPEEAVDEITEHLDLVLEALDDE